MNLDYFKSLFEQNRNILALFALVIIGSVVFIIVRMRKLKVSAERFLEEHPDAAKVFLATKILAASGTVAVHTVNGEAPVFFTEGGKPGFYLIPGNGIVEMSFTTSRPGVLYKTVTKTWGPVKKELAAGAGRTYLLSFDRQEENFTFTAI